MYLSKFFKFDEKHQCKYSQNSVILKQINTQKIKPQHNMLKLLKSKDKGIISKAVREKCKISEKDDTTDGWALSKTVETKKQ